MKKLSFLLFAAISALLFHSCSKEQTKVNDNETVTSGFTVYKNQTGGVTADALQAQYTDTKGTLNFYGVFDSENNPTQIRTLTYQKVNNDTIVNLMIDSSNRLTSSYFSVKGVKSPIIMKLDYIDNSKNINVSYYNYNWTTQTSDLIYASRIENNNGVVTENPFYASRIIGLPTFLEGVFALGTGLAVAETVGLVAGTFTLSAAAAPIIAAVLATQIVTYAAIGVGVFCISNLAGASESKYPPSSLPPPSKTPIINPVTDSSNPTPKLQTPTCINTNMSFRASMDAEGSIMITEVAGGNAPYTYMVGSGFQQSQVFSNKYKDGSYVVGIKDANDCVSVKMVSLKRPIDCANSTLAIKVTSLNNTASVSVSGGLSPYTYAWSDGSTGATATSLPNGNHTVTVTDALGCTKKGTASINFADYKITGASIGALTDVGIPCPTQYKSGNAMVSVSFNNETPPASGFISITTYWDSDADGIFEGSVMGGIEIASSQKTGNTVSAVRGFCWGRNTTVLKVEFQYTSSTGAKSTYIIPRF